jgi:hypothetical protein
VALDLAHPPPAQREFITTAFQQRMHREAKEETMGREPQKVVGKNGNKQIIKFKFNFFKI